MNGYMLGAKPLKICNAVPKPKTSSADQMSASANIQNLTTSNAITEFSQYYDPSTYWQNTALYGQSAPQTWAAYDPTTAAADYAAYYQQQAVAHIQQENATTQPNDSSHMSQAYNQQDITLVGECHVYLNDEWNISKT